MNNRIFKTLLCFTLMIAVFLSGTVFAVSPNSVLAYDVSSLENSIFVEGIETTFYQEGDTVYYVIPSGDPQAVNVDLSNSVIYGGSYGQSKTSSYVTVQSGVVIDKIYGGGYATNSSNADMNENVVISIESGATVGTVYGSGYASSGEYTADVKGSISIENIGTVGNIYGISNSLSSSEVGELVIMLFGGEVTGEVLVVEPSSPEVDFSDGSYSLEIGLSSDLILSGANSVIGSQVYPVTEIYSEADPDAEKVTVDVSNSTRSVGEVVTYLDVNIGNSEAEILSFFSSDYYQFELVNYSDYYAVKIASMVSQNASVEEDEGEDREPLSKEYTVAGTLEEESVEDESFLEEYSDITKGEDGYYVDGRYDGGYYNNGEDAVNASKSNAQKEAGEEDIDNFYNNTFEGTGLEDDGYGLEKYQEMVTKLQQTEDGGYLLDGEEYQSLEEVLDAVKDKVNEEVYERNLEKLAEKIATSTHYCDDAGTQELYSSGASVISQLGYASADKLSALYAEVMDTISVSQTILQVASTIEATYNTLIESGVLTSESETALIEFYSEILSMLEHAITNSEVEEILANFKEYIISLDVAKISLTDEDGNIIAVISQAGGMDSESAIVFSEISDMSTYVQLLESIIASGDISADNIFTALFGVSDTLEEMSVHGVYDISIDGNFASENGKYTVKVKAPEGMDSIGTVKILHITESGVQLISAKLVDGYLIFETESFSEFVILGSQATSLWYALIPISIIILLVCLYVYVCKKEKRGEINNG